MFSPHDFSTLGSQEWCMRGAGVIQASKNGHRGLRVHAHVLTHTHIHTRDDEYAYVSVNGKLCWSYKPSHITSSKGSHQCGGQFSTIHKGYETVFAVTDCMARLVGSGNQPLTVRVWTNLDGNARDESFGIDNVVITKDRPPEATQPVPTQPSILTTILPSGVCTTNQRE